MVRTIMAVTGSRADYGLLYWVMKAIQEEAAFRLQVVVTGMHLSPEFGMTVLAVERDGFPVTARVDSLLSGDSAATVTKSIGVGVIGFGDLFAQVRPDMILLLGDRFEILAAAQAALVARIPIAHIAGGDLTEGAFDDAIRHCITKMAHLHFVTNAAAEKRVKQLGENSRFIFNVGSPGLDALRHAKLLGREELESLLGFAFRPRNLLVTFHPATLEAQEPEHQLAALLRALDRLGKDFGVVFTKANADPRGRALNRMLEAYVSERSSCRLFEALGQQVYLSVMQQVNVVVGNSSSGLYEAPSLCKPTVNIGSRQHGRLRAASVLDCAPDTAAIEHAILAALSLDCSKVVNPYGDGHSAARIVAALKAVPDPHTLLEKRFADA